MTLNAANGRKSASSQAAYLLDYLKTHLKISTLDARNELGIMHPAQRISELRCAGHPIETSHAYQDDDNGVTHWIAVYVWRGGQPSQADLFEADSDG
jgi:hypothetical protein